MIYTGVFYLDNKSKTVCQFGAWDYSYAFLQNGFSHLNAVGKMAYIVPNSIFKTKSGRHIRALLRRSLIRVLDYTTINVFGKALTSPAIIIIDKRDADKSAQWFEYGRSQALTHINQSKILISTVITGKIRAYPLETDEIPYSGLFITVKDRPDALPLTEAMAILNSTEFFEYFNMWENISQR